MKYVKSVYREIGGERVFDPAEKHVDAFNRAMEFVEDKELANVLEMHLEEIIKVRLTQDNTIVEGSETGAMYHERRRGQSGIMREQP